MLVDSLRVTMANVFVLYFKSHSYHWNVEGPDFAQYHDFIGNFYNDLWGSVDTIAEGIRTLDSYAPISLAKLVPMSEVEESETIPDARGMLSNMRRDNDKVLAQLLKVYKEAEDSGEIGIANLLQNRIETHEKHAWMLRAITK